MILEGQRQQTLNDARNRTTLTSNAVDDDPSYDQLEAQLYNPLPPYLAQAPSTPILSLPLAVDRAASGGLADGIPALYGPSGDMIAGVQPEFCLNDMLGNGSAWKDSHILDSQRGRNGSGY